jgi:hypothetical protein
VTLEVGARFACSTASSTPARKLAASASSGGNSNPMTTFALSGAAQAGQEQPAAANTTAETRETLRERDNAGLASDTSRPEF